MNENIIEMAKAMKEAKVRELAAAEEEVKKVEEAAKLAAEKAAAAMNISSEISRMFTQMSDIISGIQEVEKEKEEATKLVLNLENQLKTAKSNVIKLEEEKKTLEGQLEPFKKYFGVTEKKKSEKKNIPNSTDIYANKELYPNEVVLTTNEDMTNYIFKPFFIKGVRCCAYPHDDYKESFIPKPNTKYECKVTWRNNGFTALVTDAREIK